MTTLYAVEKFKVHTEDHTLKVSTDDGAGYEFELDGWVTAWGEGSGTWLVLEVETGWRDRDTGLPGIAVVEFEGAHVLDLADRVLKWATNVRLMDEKLEAELALEP